MAHKTFFMMGGGGAACFPTCLNTIYFTDKTDFYCISDILHNDGTSLAEWMLLHLVQSCAQGKGQ